MINVLTGCLKVFLTIPKSATVIGIHLVAISILRMMLMALGVTKLDRFMWLMRSPDLYI